ncbi:MAG: hypothetical protein ABI304_08800 [Rudaea sp.]
MHMPSLLILVARKSLLPIFCATLLLSLTPDVRAASDPCIDNAVLGITPLTDMAPGSTYHGFPGNLYPDGNAPPDTLTAAALARALSIRPLAADGTPDAQNGRIVLLSVGMSNATQEYSDFVAMAGADPRRAPHVLTVDGAQGGRDAGDWVDPGAPTWSEAIAHLQDSTHGGAPGITPAQVQAMWLKQAIKQPRNLPGAEAEFPGHAQLLQADLAAIARSALANFPNLRLIFLTSRTRAYVVSAPPPAPALENPEPYAFESGFAVKWVIADQIAGNPQLNSDPANGPVLAPLLVWGPYIWADGTMPRLDGFDWLCSDTRSPPNPNADYTHPSPQGQAKIGGVLLNFFVANEFARPWFVANEIFSDGFETQ